MNTMTFRKKALYMAIALGISACTLHSAGVMAQADTAVEQTENSSATAPQFVSLPDKMQTVEGRIEGDGAGEYRYYSFTAVRGQHVLLWLEQPQAPFVFEYKEGDAWRTLVQDSHRMFHSLTPGQDIQVRVSKARPDTANVEFKFRIGSAPYRTVSDEIIGEATHLRSFSNDFQAFRKVDWHIRMKDSTGHPVEGAKVTLDITINEETKATIITDAEGKGSSVINLPGCEPSIWSPVYERPMGPFQYRWMLRYNKHRITTMIENNPLGPQWQEGRINNVFGHICQEWLIG